MMKRKNAAQIGTATLSEWELERVWEEGRQKDRGTEICSSDPEMETEIDSATLYSTLLYFTLSVSLSLLPCCLSFCTAECKNFSSWQSHIHFQNS